MRDKLYTVKVPGNYAKPRIRPLAMELRKPMPMEENLPTTYQGKKVGSVLEARSIVALLYLRYAGKFTYQAVVNRGRQVRGGQVLDFLVYTPGLPTAVYVNGEYWHSSGSTYEDEIKIHTLMEMYSSQIKIKILWGRDLESVSQAITSWIGVLR